MPAPKSGANYANHNALSTNREIKLTEPLQVKVSASGDNYVGAAARKAFNYGVTSYIVRCIIISGERALEETPPIVEKSATMASYERMETQFSLVVGMAGFACIGLIFIDSPYFAAFVLLAAVFGFGRYVVRKKIKVLSIAEGEIDYEYNPWTKKVPQFKYPAKPGRDSPFTDLLRKLGH